MRKKPLDRLAEAYGLQLSYRSDTKEVRTVSDAAKRAVLRAMSVGAGDDAAVARSLAAAPFGLDSVATAPRGVRCFIPAWLEDGRAWGITCQLYALRSARNHGIGDFEDLAALAEIVAARGADFVGINPVHALFTSDPDRCSPFSPSNREFLNPFYIALDRVPGIDPPFIDEAVRARLCVTAQVDYRGVASFKMGALRGMWSAISGDPSRWAPQSHTAYERFVAAGGAPLRDHCVFEAISHDMVAGGGAAGWSAWPPEYRHPDNPEVARFAERRSDEVRFHMWLQWIADTQLQAAAARARAAGMRIGLYLDFAVGTAPDGSATWSDRELVVPGANIGAPPDAFFRRGQDWGLAPMAPTALRDRAFTPYREVLRAAARHAGAIRIDHAMSLERLFWIPHGMPPREGCYVRYPTADMLRTLADLSVDQRAIIVGEDLGTVPSGFRSIMRGMNMLSYRLLYFERSRGGFRAAASYRRNAFVAVSTHDLPPLASWWSGQDIELYHSLGLVDDKVAAERRQERAVDRRSLVARLRRDAAGTVDIDRDGGAQELSVDFAVAVHAFLARTPSMLLALQFEDLCGSTAPVNIAGTWNEYPNWRLRPPVSIEDAPRGPLWQAIIAAVACERPSPS